MGSKHDPGPRQFVTFTEIIVRYTYLDRYSSLPNNCAGWNKRVGMKFPPKIINV